MTLSLYTAYALDNDGLGRNTIHKQVRWPIESYSKAWYKCCAHLAGFFRAHTYSTHTLTLTRMTGWQLRWPNDLEPIWLQGALGCQCHNFALKGFLVTWRNMHLDRDGLDSPAAVRGRHPRLRWRVKSTMKSFSGLGWWSRREAFFKWLNAWVASGDLDLFLRREIRRAVTWL